MTRRRPLPSVRTATFPALVTFLAACTRNATTHDADPARPPLPPQPPHPPIEADAGVAPFEPVVLVPPDEPMPLAGAPMMVTPLPVPTVTGLPPSSPSPAPSPAPSPRRGAPSSASAPEPAAPMAAPAAPMAAPPHPLLAGRAAGVYLVHDHPQGTPCRPVSRTEVDALRQRLAPR